jgi:hypothetical protein
MDYRKAIVRLAAAISLGHHGKRLGLLGLLGL